MTFFEPVENDLKVLNLSSNIIEEVSPDDVGQLRRLRCIDISRSDYTVEDFLGCMMLMQCSLIQRHLR